MRTLREYLEDKLLESKLLEQAISRSDEKHRILGIADVLIEHIVLVHTNIDDINIQHWKIEILAFMKPIIMSTLKDNSYKTRKRLFDHVINAIVLDDFSKTELVKRIQSAIIDHTPTKSAKSINAEADQVYATKHKVIYATLERLSEYYAKSDYVGLRRYIDNL
jgi:hypothetical protein